MRWAAALSERRLGLSRRRVPLLLQQERAECGLAALGMIAAYHGKALTLAALRRRLGGWPRGMTVADLVAAADRLELVARPLRLSLAELPRLRLPAILHWRLDHFVVVTAVGRRGVVVHDPARGRRRIRRAELDDAFTGIAVELVPAPRFRPCRDGAELSLTDLLKSIDGIGRYLGMMLFLLLVTQVLTLVPPVATQLLIDEVVLGQDRAWLMAALGGLALVMLAGVVLETLRRWIGVYAGTRVAADCTVGVVRHLLRLPTSFLRERHLGDLMSKLGSLAPIRQAMTETGLNGVAQLAVLVSTVAIMCYYSVSLAAVSVGGWLLSAAAAVAVLPASRRHAEQAVVHGARQDSSLLETLRAAEVVRALGLGGRRLADWQDHFYASTNARVAQAKLTVISRGCADTVLALEQLAFLAVGITGLVEQRLTLGALFAFLTLRNRLGAAAGALLAAASSLYLTRVHTRRLSDIALAPAPAAPCGGALRRVRGRLSARSLAFRYAQGPWILEGFDCEIPAGAMVVITGPSGCGKTTLLRLLAGAEPAEEGCVALDGLELALWDPGHLRRQVGTVLQEDALFKGTIADNISGFDPSVDAARMRQAAVLADVWTDIRSMPLAHRTPVGDMGSTLSGGQRQRIVLARALYRMPRLLFLDEATSHLDVATERRIMDRLARLGITVVSVAHRPDVVERATHVIELRAACRPDSGT